MIMKKLLLVALSALSIVSMTGCGGESKKEWTSEEITAMVGTKKNPGYVAEALPFYKAKFEVTTTEDESALLLQGGRKASVKDVEAYAQLLDDAGYIEREVSEDFADFVDTVDLDTAVEFVSNYLDPEYDEPEAYQDVIVVGLDEDSKLVVYATTWVAMFGGEFSNTSMGFNNKYFEELGDNVFGYYTNYLLEWLIEGNGFTYSNELAAYFNLPAFADTEGFWGLDEDTLYSPWTLGNCFSEQFAVGYSIYFQGLTADEHADCVGFYQDEENGWTDLGAEEQKGVTYYAFALYTSEHSCFYFETCSLIDGFWSDGSAGTYISICYLNF